jgi:hypothetical protein
MPMEDHKPQRNFTGIWRLVDRPAALISRVWRCGTCGAKVFYCRAVTQPQCHCLCGEKQWENGMQDSKLIRS